MINNAINNTFIKQMTVKKSTAGSTTYLNIENPDNSDASSISSLNLDTGGASGGDSSITFYNNVNTFSVGIDNSDSDCFIISENASLGTSNSLKYYTSGNCTYPANSCFSVNAGGTNASNVTGNGTYYTPVLSTSRFNIGSNFSSNKFTAPIDGIYFFSSNMYINGASARIHFGNLLYNGATLVLSSFQSTANSAVDGSANFGCILKLTAGDQIQVQIVGFNDTGNIDDFYGNVEYSWFTGALIS